MATPVSKPQKSRLMVVVLVARDWVWSYQGKEWKTREEAVLECFEMLQLKDARTVLAAYCVELDDMHKVELPARVIV